MQLPQPTTEHHWLLQFVGEWDFVHECEMGSGLPSSKTIGTQSTRAIGSLWTQGEMLAPGPDDQPMTSIMTLGFDPVKGKFIGSFIASCMTHLWLYEGSLDAAGRILTLDAAGPSFTSPETMANYQDIIEVVDANTYQFRSRVQHADGSWFDFMNGTYTRRS